MRNADTIEQAKERNSMTAKMPSAKPKRVMHPKSLANLKPFQPGVSGNPGGRRKDLSREISRQVFENNPELMYQSACHQAMNTPYGYDVHSSRAYGKLTEKRELTGANGGPIETLELTDEQLRSEITELKQRLGFAERVATTATIGALEPGVEPTNVAQQDPELLPR